MNYLITVITFILIILLLIKEIKIWRVRVLLSPAFFFAVIWGFGVFGLLLLEPFGLIYEPYPKNIDRLNILVSFTSICFLLWSNRGREMVNEEGIEISYLDWGTYKILSLVLFIAALYEFYSLGGSINVGAARENVADIVSNKSTIVSYIATLSVPLSCIAGYWLMTRLYLFIKLSFIDIVFLILPLLANMIFSLEVGGRVSFIYAFASYLVGVSLSLPLRQTFQQGMRSLLYIIVGCVIATSFITAIANARYEYSIGTKSSMQQYMEAKSPLLGAIFGPVEYVIASYSGFQLRMEDAVDLSNLGYGKYTFNGFINWTLPFSAQVGLGNFSIAKVLGIYYFNQETYDHQREMYYTTHSAYIPIIKDFGIWGAFACIFFLTFIAHNFFVAIQCRNNINHAITFFFFYLFWDYWAKSNFYGTLSSSVLMPLYGLLLVDIVYSFTRK